MRRRGDPRPAPGGPASPRPGRRPTARARQRKRPSRSDLTPRSDVPWGAVLRPGRALLSSPLAGGRPGGLAIELPHVVERVDLLGGLVVPQPHDPRKPPGESRGMQPANHAPGERDIEPDPG